MNEPKIRFRGFDGEWKETKFGEHIVSVRTGTNLLGEVSNTGIPLLKMGNIQRGYFSLNKMERLKENTFLQENYIAKYGDFFYNTRNTLELVGKGATWMKKDGTYAFNSNIARCDFNGIDTFFFNYLYNIDNVISQVHARAKGTTSVAAIYLRDLVSIKLVIPLLEEQRSIASFFSTLDSLISSATSRLGALKQVKEASLQAMFPQEGETVPKIRFKGFDGDWKKVRLYDCLEISNERNQNNEYGINEVLSVSDEEGVMNQIELLGRSYAGKSVANYKILHTNQVVYTKSPLKAKPYGIIKVNKGNVGIVSVLYAVYDAKGGISPDYIHYYFSPTYRINNYLRPLINKGAKNTMNISDDVALQGDIMLPNTLEEQVKIVKFLQSLDKQITLQSQRLEKLKQIKAACLDKMFV